MSSFQKRVVSGALAFLVLGTILYFKGIVFNIAILLLSIIASYEFVSAFKKKNHRPNLFIVISIVVSFLVLLFNWSYFNASEKFAMLMLYLSLLTLFIFITTFISLAKKMDPMDMMINIFPLFYIGFPLGIISLFAQLKGGFPFMYMIFIICFSSDIFAYQVGRSIGKHKLAPKMSPNKTIEGSIGGIVGTIIVLFAFRLVGLYDFSFFRIFILGIFGSGLAQLGDLTASILKRYTGIKDFGKIMPGHGGILDRMDSIIFVSPLVFLDYFLITYTSLLS